MKTSCLGVLLAASVTVGACAPEPPGTSVNSDAIAGGIEWFVRLVTYEGVDYMQMIGIRQGLGSVEAAVGPGGPGISRMQMIRLGPAAVQTAGAGSGGASAGSGVLVLGAKVVVIVAAAVVITLVVDRLINGDWAWETITWDSVTNPGFWSVLFGGSGDIGPNPAYVTVGCYAGDYLSVWKDRCRDALGLVVVDRGTFWNTECEDVYEDYASPFFQTCWSYVNACAFRQATQCGTLNAADIAPAEGDVVLRAGGVVSDGDGRALNLAASFSEGGVYAMELLPLEGEGSAEMTVWTAAGAKECTPSCEVELAEAGRIDAQVVARSGQTVFLVTGRRVGDVYGP